MKQISFTPIERILAESPASYFLIYLHTEDSQLFTWREDGFGHVTEGHNETLMIPREEITQISGRALRDARTETFPSLFSGGGRLEIVPINLHF